MTATQTAPAKTTLDEYFEFEWSAKGRHEFRNGKIKPMAYTSPPHGLIASNLHRLLANLFFDTPFDVFAGDRMLFVPACNENFYPDLMILPVERPTQIFKRKMVADLAPVVLVEILSDSTQHDDFNDKWTCYQQIESLEQYFLVSQDKAFVQVFSRKDAESGWKYLSFSDESAEITVLGNCILLKDIYRRVIFPPQKKRPNGF